MRVLDIKETQKRGQAQKKFYISNDVQERLNYVQANLQTRYSQSTLINIALKSWLDGAEAGIRSRENIERKIRERQFEVKAQLEKI